MSATAIESLTQRLEQSDPQDSQTQREIFERIRELRSAFDGPLDPESQRCLEAAGMLVAYLARMGALAGDDVRAIAVRLLRAAFEAESCASKPKTPEAAAAIRTIGRSSPKPPLPDGPASPVPAPAPEKPERSATELMGDMMLGQILLHRGHILEEHIHQAMKVQRTTSMRIGDIFVKIGACSRQQLADALSHQAACRRIRGGLESEAERLEQVAKADTRGTGLKLMGEILLGEILIERGVITRRQLERALEVQKATGVRIGEALVKLGATTMENIDQALRIQGQGRKFGGKLDAKR